MEDQMLKKKACVLTYISHHLLFSPAPIKLKATRTVQELIIHILRVISGSLSDGFMPSVCYSCVSSERIRWMLRNVRESMPWIKDCFSFPF